MGGDEREREREAQKTARSSSSKETKKESGEERGREERRRELRIPLGRVLIAANTAKMQSPQGGPACRVRACASYSDRLFLYIYIIKSLGLTDSSIVSPSASSSSSSSSDVCART